MSAAKADTYGTWGERKTQNLFVYIEKERKVHQNVELALEGKEWNVRAEFGQ